jgi:AAA+ superfamily predicted ATPase
MKRPELRDYLQAGYPLLHLSTLEYETAVRHVIDSMLSIPRVNKNHALAIWKVTTNLRVGTLGSGVGSDTVGEDLIECLRWVENRREEDPVVAIFHNPREFLPATAVFQSLIDAAMSAKETGSHIIILGPDFPFPIEIRNVLTRVDYPLPTRDQLLDNFSKIAMAYGEKLTTPDGGNWRTDMKEVKDASGIVTDLELAPWQNDLLKDAASMALGLDSVGAENAFCLSVATAGTVDLDLIQIQKEAEVRKSDVLEFVRYKEGLDQVGGMDAMKQWLTKRRLAFTDAARAYGLPFPKGILLVGPGGTGKSLAAKATASYLKLPLLRLDMGRIFRSLVGESEASMRLALQVAEAISPCVLWLDEIDRALAGSKTSGELDSGVTARVVATILTWRAETVSPVMLVATANDVSSLPSMVYRKGRFDEIWSTDMPQPGERADIFRIHIEKRGRDPQNYSLDELSTRTEGWVGAEIEAAVEEALFTAFEDDAREMTTQDLMRAISETIPQSKREGAWVARPVSSKETDQKKRAGKLRSMKILREE